MEPHIGCSNYRKLKSLKKQKEKKKNSETKNLAEWEKMNYITKNTSKTKIIWYLKHDYFAVQVRKSHSQEYKPYLTTEQYSSSISYLYNFI